MKKLLAFLYLAMILLPASSQAQKVKIFHAKVSHLDPLPAFS
jgi:hypothetical protein